VLNAPSPATRWQPRDRQPSPSRSDASKLPVRHLEACYGIRPDSVLRKALGSWLNCTIEGPVRESEGGHDTGISGPRNTPGQLAGRQGGSSAMIWRLVWTQSGTIGLIKPRALARQRADHDPHPLAGLFDVKVALPHPAAHHLAAVPGGPAARPSCRVWPPSRA